MSQLQQRCPECGRYRNDEGHAEDLSEREQMDALSYEHGYRDGYKAGRLQGMKDRGNQS